MSVMPTNLYGPGDNFDLNTSHVLPALLRKFHEVKVIGASEVTVWGTDMARREFCHVDDCAAACLHLMQVYDGEEIVNVGVGDDISIRELAELIAEVVGYRGQIVFDTGRPDGPLVKRVDSRVIKGMGWHPTIALEQGIRSTYEWYLRNNVIRKGNLA